MMACVFIEVLLLAMTSVIGLTSADRHLYISATGGSLDPQCGSSIDFPCAGFEGMFNATRHEGSTGGIVFLNGTNLFNSSEGDHYVYYLPGVYNASPVFMYNFHSWSFVGIGEVTVRVDNFYGHYELLWPLMSTVELEVLTVRRYPAAFYFRECTDIWVENIKFSIDHFTPDLAGVTYDLSSDVVVQNCSFTEVSLDSSAAVVVHPAGPVLFSDCSIQSLHGVGGYKQLILVAFSGFDGDPDRVKGLVTVTLNNVKISDIVSGDYRLQSLQQLLSGTMPYPTYDFRSNWKAATAVLVLFRKGSLGDVFSMRNCVIHNVKPNDNRSPVTIQFQEAILNLVEINGCTFSDNFGSVGGSVAVFFYKNVGFSVISSNQVHFTNCSFINNTALFNGGAVSVDYLTSAVTNNVIFENTQFIGNQATFGGALLLRYDLETDGSQHKATAKQVTLTDCVFYGNKANHGIVYANRVTLIVDGTSVFDRNEESCVVLISSLFHLGGYPQFTGNHAVDGAAISANEGSMVYMSDVRLAQFVDNVVERHGGVMWADHDTTAETYNQFLLHSTSYIDSSRPCFVSFGNEGPPTQTEGSQNNTRFIFDGNRAGVEGDVFYSFSFRHCWLGNFLPLPSYRVGSDGLNSIVTSFKNVKEGNYITEATTAASAPNFFALNGASCRCFKPVGPVYISIARCLDKIALSVFSSVPGLNDSADGLSREFYGEGGYNPGGSANPSAGIGVTPPSALLYFPWSFTVYDDSKEPGVERRATLQPNPSLITVTPAPGEVFDLNFTLHGQFMEPSDVTAYIQVESIDDQSSCGVLLEYNGFEYPTNTRIYFSPNSPLAGLRLHGLEGTAGVLVARAASHVLGLELVVRVPFVLATCPRGFFPPAATFQKKEEVLFLFKLSGPRAVVPTYQLAPFACNCYSINDTYNSAVSYCTNGRTAHVYKSTWLGDPSPSKPVNKTSDCDLIGFIPPNNEVSCYTREPWKVVKVNRTTAFADCVLNFCKDINLDTWTESEGICGANRLGPLCGECEGGYAVTPSSLDCVKCDDQQGLIGFLTLFIGLVIVLAAILLNIRISPVGAGLLFFTQMSALFLNAGSGAYFIIHLVNLDFSFGLCYSSDLTAVQRLASHFAPPVYMLVLVISFTVLASRVRRISRYVSRRSCLHGVWLIILLSYFSLANVAFSFMRCVKLSPSNAVSSSYRFLDDPGLACYENPHLSLFIVSCLVAGFFILPFPVVVLLLRRSSRFKPFADVCYSLYKDSRWWWCALDLQRRLLFTLINTFVSGQDDKMLKSALLILSAVLVLLIHGIGSPYRSQFENIFESLLLFDLCCLSVISAGWGDRQDSWLAADLVYIPWLVAVGMWTYQKRHQLIKLGQKIGMCSGYKMKSPQGTVEDSIAVKSDTVEGVDSEEIEMLVKRRGSTVILAGLRDPLLEGEGSHE